MNTQKTRSTRLAAALLGFALTVSAQTPSVNWTLIGPTSINGQGGSVQSGKLQAIAVYPGDPNIIYAGGGVGTGVEGPQTGTGIFKTIDGGVTWTPVNNGLTDPVIDALWVSPTDSNVALAGTESAGIFRTTDGGQSWKLVTTSGTPDNPDTKTPAVPGTNGTVSDFATFGANILAAGQPGLLRSTDGGVTWAVFVSLTVRVRALASAGGVLAFSTENGGFLVRPSASSPIVHPTLPVTNAAPQSIAIDPAAPLSMYVVMGPTASLVATADGGNTWSKLTVPGNPRSVAVTPGTHTVYAGTDNTILKSTDSGQTWTPVAGAPWTVRRIYLPDDSTILIGTDQGIHQLTADSPKWKDLSGPVPASITMSVASHNSTLLTVDRTAAPILTYDAGATWTQPFASGANTPNGQDGMAAVNPGDSSYWYAMTQGGFQFSTDHGKTFRKSAVAGLSSQPVPFPYGESLIAVDTLNPSTVYVAAATEFFISKDSGVTMAASGWGFAKPSAIAISPADSRILLAGTSTGLFRSTDGGSSWNSVALAGAAGYPATIAVNPMNPSVVLVGMSKGWGNGGGVLRSLDGGVTFSLFNGGLPSLSPNQNNGVEIPAIRFSADGVAAMATVYGIYLSSGGAPTWIDISANAVPHIFNDVEWDGSYLYTATPGNGVLRSQPLGPPSATLATDATPFTFSSVSGASSPAPQSFQVTSSQGALPFSAVGAGDGKGTWLVVTPFDAVTPAIVKVTVDATGLAPGTYTGKVTLLSTSAGNSPSIPVTLTVTASNVTVISVVNAASFNPVIAPGTWVAIQGSNLSQTTRTWTGADFKNGALPTQLDGVSVRIGSKPALVYYVSPTQINVLSPDGGPQGPVAIQVSSPLGGSNSFSATQSQTSPAFFLIAGKYIAAVHLDGTLVGPVGFVPGLASTPAKPGETILLYGTGFGPTNPASPSATINPAEPLQNSVVINFGSQQGLVGQVSYEGVVSPGLVQFNLTVPPTTQDGDVALFAGATGGGHFIAVQK